MDILPGRYSQLLGKKPVKLRVLREKLLENNAILTTGKSGSSRRYNGVQKSPEIG